MEGELSKNQLERWGQCSVTGSKGSAPLSAAIGTAVVTKTFN